MALSKLKKFVTEEVMDENNEDEYYDADKAVVPGNGKMILLELILKVSRLRTI